MITVAQFAVAGLRRDPVARPRQVSCVARRRSALPLRAGGDGFDQHRRSRRSRPRPRLPRTADRDRSGLRRRLHVPVVDLQPRIPARIRAPAPAIRRALDRVAAGGAASRWRCVPKARAAYLALLVVLFNRRDLPGAFAAAEKSIALNRYDMLALGEYGGRLISHRRGRARHDDDAARRFVRRGAPVLAAHLPVRRQLPDRRHRRRRRVSPTRSRATISRSARWRGRWRQPVAGDAAGARQAIDRLVKMQPSWRDDPRVRARSGHPRSGDRRPAAG